MLGVTLGCFALGSLLALLGVGVPCPAPGAAATLEPGRYVVDHVSDGGDLQLYSAIVEVKGDEVIVTYDRDDGTSWRIRYEVTSEALERLAP